MRATKQVTVLSALAGVTLLVGTQTVQAAVITETETINLSHTVPPDPSSVVSQTLTFDRFDPALGTLTGLRLILTSTVETAASVQVRQLGGGFAGQTTTDSAVNVRFEFSDILSINLANPDPQFQVIAQCEESPAGGCQDSDLLASPLEVTSDQSGESDALFAVTGTGTFSADALAIAVIEPFCQFGDHFPACAHAGGIKWSGTLTVEYTYDAKPQVSVPEPGALALFGAGLAGLGLVRRRS